MLGQRKEMIIVCDKGLVPCADYLISLIGQNDDEGEIVVGVKDGSLSAAVYSPKQYRDSKSKISSNTPILFIGDFKEAKEQAKVIRIRYEKYGMCYGWLGKRAVMYIKSPIINPITYKEFIDYAYEIKHSRLKIHGSTPDFLPLKAIKSAGRGVKDWLFTKDLQYKCLTSLFYLDGLKMFLEE